MSLIKLTVDEDSEIMTFDQLGASFSKSSWEHVVKVQNIIDCFDFESTKPEFYENRILCLLYGYFNFLFILSLSNKLPSMTIYDFYNQTKSSIFKCLVSITTSEDYPFFNSYDLHLTDHNISNFLLIIENSMKSGGYILKYEDLSKMLVDVFKHIYQYKITENTPHHEFNMKMVFSIETENVFLNTKEMQLSLVENT